MIWILSAEEFVLMMNNGKGMRWRNYSGEIIKPMTVSDSKKNPEDILLKAS